MKSRLFFTTLALFVVVSAARIVTAQDAEAAKVKNPIASTPESIAAGQVVFRKCAPCHGNMGQGGPGNDLIPPAPSLVDHLWEPGSTEGQIFKHLKNGIGPDFNMVPWKDMLKDEDIWNVVNYIRSIHKK